MMMPDGQIGFVGKDVAEVLGYSIPQNAILQHVSEDDRMTLTFKAFSKMEKASLWRDNDYSNKTIINESGLYSLILSSKLPQAREFKHWVTSEELQHKLHALGIICRSPSHAGCSTLPS